VAGRLRDLLSAGIRRFDALELGAEQHRQLPRSAPAIERQAAAR
jgi:hypothetical protein